MNWLEYDWIFIFMIDVILSLFYNIILWFIAYLHSELSSFRRINLNIIELFKGKSFGVVVNESIEDPVT